MNKLGVLVLGLVLAGVSFFALSVFSSRRASVDREPPLSQRASSDDASLAAAGRLGPGGRPRGDADPARRSVPEEDFGRTREGRSGSGEGAIRNSGGADVIGAGVAQGGAGSAAPRDSVESRDGRRDHLVDRLARDGAGGAALGEDQEGKQGGPTAGSWEVAKKKGEGEAFDADGDGVVEPDEGDLMLSLPLAGSTSAEGSVQPVAEENLKVDEETGEIEFPENSVLEFPDAASIIQPEAGTLSLEIVPNWDGTDPGDSTFVQVRRPGDWQGTFLLFRNGRYLRLLTFDHNAQEADLGVDIGDWKAGERHTVTATWGEALLSIYIDGQLAGQRAYSGDINIPPGTPLYVGSNPGSVMVPGARAKLSNFKVYGHVLGAGEIAGGASGAGQP